MVQYNDRCNAAEVVEASCKLEAWAKREFYYYLKNS